MSAPSATPRSRARRGDGARLRSEILAAATDLLRETEDEAAVSVRAVAARVGVTPPSIYLHFADKNALLFECCRQLMGRLHEEIIDGTAMIGDPAERLRVAAHAFVRFGLDNPEPYRIMLMSPHHDVPPDFDPDSYEGLLAFRALEGMVAAVLGVRDDELDAAAAEQVSLHAMALLSAVHGVTSMMVAKAVEPIDFPWPRVEALTDHVMDIHLAALTAPR